MIIPRYVTDLFICTTAESICLYYIKHIHIYTLRRSFSNNICMSSQNLGALIMCLKNALRYVTFVDL